MWWPHHSTGMCTRWCCGRAGDSRPYSDDQVHQSSGDHDHLARRGARQESLDLFVGQRRGFQGVLIGVGGHHHPSTHLAVDLNRVLDGVVDEVGGVGLRERAMRQ